MSVIIIFIICIVAIVFVVSLCFSIDMKRLLSLLIDHVFIICIFVAIAFDVKYWFLVMFCGLALHCYYRVIACDLNCYDNISDKGDVDNLYHAIDHYIDNMQSVRCESGIRQLNILEKKHRIFKEIISAKLSTEELAYARYDGMADQVYSAVMDNLKKSFFALKCAQSIDNKYILLQLDQLNEDESIRGQTKKKSLQQRLNIWVQQTDLANSLLLHNEQALTELDFVIARIARIDINKGRSKIDLDKVMIDSNRLTGLIGKYYH